MNSLFLSCFAPLSLLGAIAISAHADVSVDAGKIVRDRPPGVGGTVIDAHSSRFATGAEGIDYGADLKRAKVKLVRNLTYPDNRAPDHDLAYFDRNVQAITSAGAQPLWIQYIKPDLPFLKENGSPGGTVESNVVFLVKHYSAAPFNLRKQIWEISNEPDLKIDYQVQRPEEYAEIFNRVHDALVKAGLRESVTLCGPVISYPYKWTNLTLHTAIMDDFLEKCKHSVDVVTYHNYAGAPGVNGVLTAPHKLDYMEDFTRKFEINPKTGNPKDVYGTPALLAKMDAVKLTRPNVGIGLTEHNTTTQHNRITGGIYNLAVTHYFLYNPRGRFTTSFVFDHYGGRQGGHGHYDSNKTPNFAYWALWVRGNLTGDQVLEGVVTPNADKSSVMKDKRLYLIVTATKNANNLYLEVINRDIKAIRDRVEVRGLPAAVSPAIHIMAEPDPFLGMAKEGEPKPAPLPKNTVIERITPDKSTPSTLGTAFSYDFPPLSATIFKFPLR